MASFKDYGPVDDKPEEDIALDIFGRCMSAYSYISKYIHSFLHQFFLIFT